MMQTNDIGRLSNWENELTEEGVRHMSDEGDLPYNVSVD